MRPFLIAVAVAAAAVLGLFTHPAPATAKDPQQMTFYVGNAPGGSFDLYVRLVAKYMQRHLPGRPAVVVQYQPGSGTRTLAHYLYGSAKNDGSEVGQLAGALMFDPMLSPQFETANMDVRKFAFIGSAATAREVCMVWHASQTANLDDAHRRPVSMGVSSPIDDRAIALRVANRLLGTQFKIIAGYTGGASTNLAMERGEIDGRCVDWATLKATQPDWISDRSKVKFILQVATAGNPELKDVPVIADRIHDDLDKAALGLIFAPQEIGYPFVAPPGASKETVLRLRQAFAESMADPDLLAEAQSRNIEIDPVSGAKVQDIVTKAYAAPAEVIVRARQLIAE